MGHRNGFLILLFICLIIFITGCGSGGGDSISETSGSSSNTTKVKINLASDSPGKRSASGVGDVPGEVYYIDVEVKADDMDSITEGIYRKRTGFYDCGDEITGEAVIEVLHGNDRIFIVRAYDDSACNDSGKIIHSAKSDPIDLTGEDVTLSLTMHTINYQIDTAKEDFMENMNYSEAYSKFKDLVEVDPTNQEANTFYAATRLYMLFGYSPQEFEERGTSSISRRALAHAGMTLREVLENFGFTEDYWESLVGLHGGFPKDAYGYTDLPDDSPTADEVMNTIKDYLLPEINGAIANLNTVAEGFSTTVKFSSAVGGDDIEYTADYGDVQFFKTMLNGLKAEFNILLAYDLDNLDIDYVQHKADLQDYTKNMLNIQYELDNNYIDFGRLKDPAMLTDAKSAVQNAIDAYQGASAWIRDTSTRDPSKEYIVEFELEHPAEEYKDRQDENEFRVMLAKIKDALSQTTVIGKVRPEELDEEYRNGYSYDYFKDPRDDLKVNLKSFFDGVDFREKLPEFVYDEDSGDNDIKRGTIADPTFPDPTFGDVFPTLIQADLAGSFELYPDPVIIPISWKDRVSQSSVYSDRTWYGGIVNGVSPEDFWGFEVYRSDYNPWRWVSNQDVRWIPGYHVYHRLDDQVFPDGDYYWSVHWGKKRTLLGPKNFAPGDLPIVDEYSLSVDGISYSMYDVIYVNTTTPTFKWDHVFHDPGYFYRIHIVSWDEGETIYLADRKLYNEYENGVTIPPGILYPTSSYKWRVELFDVESVVEISNRTCTAWKSLYTGNSTTTVSEEWRVGRMSHRFNRYYKQYGVRLIGKSFDDMTDEDRTITFTLDGEPFTYTFTHNDTYTEKVWDSDTGGYRGYQTYFFSSEEVDSDPHAIELVEEASLSPRHNAYVETLTPTFTWDKLPGDTGDYTYRIYIMPYGGSIIYSSSRGTDNQVTLPEGILQWGNTYWWRVRAYYEPESGLSTRISETIWRLFTTIEPQE